MIREPRTEPLRHRSDFVDGIGKLQRQHGAGMTARQSIMHPAGIRPVEPCAPISGIEPLSALEQVRVFVCEHRG